MNVKIVVEFCRDDNKHYLIEKIGFNSQEATRLRLFILSLTFQSYLSDRIGSNRVGLNRIDSRWTEKQRSLIVGSRDRQSTVSDILLADACAYHSMRFIAEKMTIVIFDRLSSFIQLTLEKRIPSLSLSKYDFASQYLDIAMRKANYMSIYLIMIQFKVALEEYEQVIY
uniref:Uncharacterized protein n=1 Tax=Onchocerca volvulus TaxID=6282 RepID=A0A8R1TN26_ONCVO